MIITWLTRYGDVIGTVRALAAQYSAGVDGTDELTLLTTDQVEKGQRLMWRDDNDRITGLVHEMIVSSARTVHDKRGKALTEVKAINSIAELYWTDVPKQSGLYVPHYTGQTDSEGNPIQNGWMLDDLMEGILDGTRWEWVDGTHFDIGGAIAYVGMRETYDVSVREIIAAAAAGFNGAELRTYVFADYDTCEVTHRYVSIAYPLAGSSVSDTQTRGRFTYSHNMTGCTRDVGDAECYTAVRVIGADILDSSGAVTGRHEVYLETQNATQLQAWGKPMPDGTVGHSVYTVTTSEESDATLMEMAAETLEEVVTPDVTYTVDVADMEGIRLREYVDTVDEDLGIRIRARVTSIKQDLLDETRGGQVTFGKTMNYAAVATSYQTQNVVTASSNTDTAKTNRVASSGRSGDSTSARVSTAERQIADLNERISGGGGGGLSWPIIADKSWWNSDDSFALFNKGHQWGLTGKDNNLGVYAMADGLTPDPQNQQWSEGSPVWEAKSGTIEGVSGTKPWLSVVHAAIQYLRFTSAPNVAHVFAQRIENPVGRGISALGFGYSGGGLFAALEPYAASTSHPGLIMRILKDTSTWVDWLRISTTSTYAFLNMYGPSASGNGSSHHSNLNLTSYEGGYGSARIFANGSSAASYYAEVKADVNSSNVPTVLLRVRDSTASGQGYGLKITHSGIYAYKNGTETAIHTF